MVLPVGYYESTLIWQCDGATRDSTIGLAWGPPDIIAPTDPADLAEQIYDFAVLSTGPCTGSFIGQDWNFLGVSVAYQTPTGPLVGEHFETVVGTGAAAQVPANSAVLMNKHTALGGRRNRGRSYWPPVYPQESIIDAMGIIPDVSVTQWQDRIRDLIGRMSVAGFDLYLLHSSPADAPTVVTSITIDNQLATQRRRMRR